MKKLFTLFVTLSIATSSVYAIELAKKTAQKAKEASIQAKDSVTQAHKLTAQMKEHVEDSKHIVTRGQKKEIVSYLNRIEEYITKIQAQLQDSLDKITKTTAHAEHTEKVIEETHTASQEATQPERLVEASKMETAG